MSLSDLYNKLDKTCVIICLMVTVIILLLILNHHRSNQNYAHNASSETFASNASSSIVMDENSTLLKPQSSKFRIVLYYTNWCGYSKMFLPEWKKFKDQINGNGIIVTEEI